MSLAKIANDEVASDVPDRYLEHPNFPGVRLKPRVPTRIGQPQRVSRAANAVCKVAGSGSAMVALRLPTAAAHALAIPGGEAPGDLHLTLVYLGSADDITIPVRQRLHDNLQAIAGRTEPFVGAVNGRGVFVNGDERVLWAAFDAPDLFAFRHAVLKACEDAGLPQAGDHGWTPHITLAYDPSDEVLADEATRGQVDGQSAPWLVKDFSLVVGGTEVIMKLRGDGGDKDPQRVLGQRTFSQLQRPEDSVLQTLDDLEAWAEDKGPLLVRPIPVGLPCVLVKKGGDVHAAIEDRAEPVRLDDLISAWQRIDHDFVIEGTLGAKDIHGLWLGADEIRRYALDADEVAMPVFFPGDLLVLDGDMSGKPAKERWELLRALVPVAGGHCIVPEWQAAGNDLSATVSDAKAWKPSDGKGFTVAGAAVVEADSPYTHGETEAMAELEFGVAKYSEDQPRDHGRFAEVDGGPSAAAHARAEKMKAAVQFDDWANQEKQGRAPWQRPKQDFVDGKVPGFVYRPDFSSVASNQHDRIAVSDAFFDDDAFGKRLVLYHEVGHTATDSMIADESWQKVLTPFKVGGEGAASRYSVDWSASSRPEEILADTYTQGLFFPAPHYSYSTDTEKALVAAVMRRATSLGFNKPPTFGLKQLENKSVLKYSPDQPRDDHGRFGEGAGGAMSSLLGRIDRPDGGFTVQPVTGEEPTTGYAVSIYPERSLEIKGGVLSREQFIGYVEKNADVLVKPDHFFGGWHDPETDSIWLDVSVVKPNEADAYKLAKEKGQIAWYDFKGGRSVNVKGYEETHPAPDHAHGGRARQAVHASHGGSAVTRGAGADAAGARQGPGRGPAQLEKYSPDQPRDERGRFGEGAGAPVTRFSESVADGPYAQPGTDASTIDHAALTAEGQQARWDAFDQKYGKETGEEARRLAKDWFSMHPHANLDGWADGTMPDGPERRAWDAIYEDTQARLAREVPGDTISVYRGIPGQQVLDAVAQARAQGVPIAAIPLQDERSGLGQHTFACGTGEHDLAASYAARRWERHGGASGVGGVVLHITVPKSSVVFSTAHSAFSNPGAPQWNEYTFYTGKNMRSIRLYTRDLEVVGTLHKGVPAVADMVFPPIDTRLHPAEAGGEDVAKDFSFGAGPGAGTELPDWQRRGEPAGALSTRPNFLRPTVKVFICEKSHKLDFRTEFQGMPVSIETRRGALRHWRDPMTGTTGSTKMPHHYGYLRLTEGADGEHVDCFIGPNPDATHAYVVRQVNPQTGRYDEDKVMLGFDSQAEAKAAYLSAYDSPDYFGSIHPVPMGEFRNRVKEAQGGPVPVTVRRDYDPDQLRDAQGRWATEGLHGESIDSPDYTVTTDGKKMPYVPQQWDVPEGVAKPPMSPDEKTVVHAYTDGEFNAINGALAQSRGETFVGGPDLQKEIDTLDKLTHTNLGKPVTLYRGMEVSDAWVSEHLKEGTTMVVPCFQSSTFLTAHASKFLGRQEEDPGTSKVMLKISGVKEGLYVKGVSTFDREEEVILPRGAHLHIDHVSGKDQFLGAGAGRRYRPVTFVEAHVVYPKHASVFVRERQAPFQTIARGDRYVLTEDQVRVLPTVTKYSEDQERDETGRWASSSGGTGTAKKPAEADSKTSAQHQAAASDAVRNGGYKIGFVEDVPDKVRSELGVTEPSAWTADTEIMAKGMVTGLDKLNQGHLSGLRDLIRNDVPIVFADLNEPSTIAATVSGGGKTMIVVNTASASETIEILKNHEANGFPMKLGVDVLDHGGTAAAAFRATMEGAAVHEAGHVADVASGGMAKRVFATELAHNVSSDGGRVHRWVLSHISKYGGESPDEALAETFARTVYHDPLPKEVSRFSKWIMTGATGASVRMPAHKATDDWWQRKAGDFIVLDADHGLPNWPTVEKAVAPGVFGTAGTAGIIAPDQGVFRAPRRRFGKEEAFNISVGVPLTMVPTRPSRRRDTVKVAGGGSGDGDSTVMPPVLCSHSFVVGTLKDGEFVEDAEHPRVNPYEALFLRPAHIGVRKYSPDQERDDHGRFAGPGSGGGGSMSEEGTATATAPRIVYGTDASIPNSPAPERFGSVAQETAILGSEEAHWRDRIEHAMIATDDGNVLVDKGGEATQVQFTPQEIRTTQLVGGAIATHNHPNGSSFSIDDVRLAANMRLAEMRAAGVDAEGHMITFRIRPGPNGWPPDKALSREYVVADDAMYNKFWPKVRSGEMSPDVANRLHGDGRWRMVAEKLGMVYDVKRA